MTIPGTADRIYVLGKLGYAGVIVDHEKYESLHYDAYYIDHVITDSLARNGDLVLSKIMSIHELLIQKPLEKFLNDMPLS